MQKPLQDHARIHMLPSDMHALALLLRTAQATSGEGVTEGVAWLADAIKAAKAQAQAGKDAASSSSTCELADILAIVGPAAHSKAACHLREGGSCSQALQPAW